LPACGNILSKGGIEMNDNTAIVLLTGMMLIFLLAVFGMLLY
jgi:hypothetical protein